MSTRGRIGLELSDGSILSVYHHYDSYPEWLGTKLNEFYTTKDAVAALIDGGDMSVCLDDDGNPNPIYYSQRGEDCPPQLDASIGAYCGDKNSGEEYHYIFKKVNDVYTWVCVLMNQFTDSDPQVVSIPA